MAAQALRDRPAAVREPREKRGEAGREPTRRSGCERLFDFLLNRFGGRERGRRRRLGGELREGVGALLQERGQVGEQGLLVLRGRQEIGQTRFRRPLLVLHAPPQLLGLVPQRVPLAVRQGGGGFVFRRRKLVPRGERLRLVEPHAG